MAGRVPSSRPRSWRGLRFRRGRDMVFPELALALTSDLRGAPSADVRRVDAYDGLAALPSASVDMVCTSPPYWGHRTYEQAHNDELLAQWREGDGADDQARPGYDWYRRHGGVLGLEPFPEWYVTHLAEIMERAARPLAPGGSLWINLGDTYFARWSSIRAGGRQGLAGPERRRRRTPSGGWRQDKQLLLLPARFAIAMQELGWILRNDLIWAKPHMAPRPETDRLRLSHEHFFHFVKRRKSARPRYWYDLSGAESRWPRCRPASDSQFRCRSPGSISE